MTKKVVTRKMTFSGLDCANCAVKIENEVKKIDGIFEASVNFATERLVIEVEAKREEELVTAVIKKIKKVEPEVRVTSQTDNHLHQDHGHHHGMEKIGTNKMIARVVVTLLLGIAGYFLPIADTTKFMVFLIAYGIIGWDIVLRAIKNSLNGQIFDENFLMALATIGAFAIRQYPEAIAVMLFYQVGELFQDSAVNHSRKSISALMDIRPDYANLKVENTTKRVLPETVKIGDLISVRPGEKVPLDGKVIDGVSMIDTSALTGESVPRKITSGQSILSGTINKNGLLTIEVTKLYGDSTVSKILELVENASSNKAPTENFITKFARFYTPIIVLMALGLALLPPLLFADAQFSDWLYRALIFLVISCPCALVVSIPLGFFGGIGAASKKGILIKGSNYLEALNDAKYVVFDKTGTLTKGAFEVTTIHPIGKITKEELLGYAAAVESHSNHPIAISILEAYGQDIDKNTIQKFEEISGYGISAVIKGKAILAGNAKLLTHKNISFEEVTAVGTIVYLALDNQYAGYLIIEDEVKKDSIHAIQLLKELGMKKTIMLTGDSKTVGEKVANELGIDEVYSELLPQQKVEEIEKLESQKKANEKIVFVGDGINDTPVLARSDIGIAMGGLGSDAVIETADIVIMTDEVSKIADAIQIAKRTRKIVWQNIVFALVVKSIFLILGTFGIATMWEAVFSDVGVTLLAILNAMRILKE